ncbi:outer membrane beta-barrel protein [Candidatus Methylocalor cossyra]|uniref:OMP_b-brl domain-containing protein n=1 Tax=Candidatus Methylocalor cossyra TaxID=3108543 RepID=A0ABM9NLU0_9GAMM
MPCRPTHSARPIAAGIVLAILTALTGPARAELDLRFYAGKSVTDDGDLTLKQGNTHLTLHGVTWQDKSFESPIYWGARIGYWFDSRPNWGLSIDYTHAKTYLDDTRNARVSGIRDGVPVGGVEPIQRSIESFNMSHGLNMITFNGMYRWFAAGRRDESLLGRLQLYAGLGAGFSVPHVEAELKGRPRTYEYQAGAGPVVNGMVGVNYDLYKFLSGFLEYKLSYADVDAELKGGGTISTETVTHQFVFGVAAHFDP